MIYYNLEKLALEQLVRPYQNLKWGKDTRFESLPISMDELTSLLSEINEWSDVVLHRFSRIGVQVPNYIHHDLIDFLKNDSRVEHKVNKKYTKFFQPQPTKRGSK